MIMKRRTSRPLIFTYSILLILLISGCEWPFNTTETKGDIFVLSSTHNITRLLTNAQIHLSWSEITIDNFLKYKIERKRIKDTIWTSVADISDAFQHNYIDTIWDDDDLIYRVGIEDNDSNIKWAIDTLGIPNTTNIIVPEEIGKIQSAIECNLVDDGDVIIVRPGIYDERIILLGKIITLKSENGFINTIIDGGRGDNTIVMNGSTIEGFTVTEGAARHKIGGGIIIQDNGTVRNCLVSNNYAESKGGGIYINGNGSVYNTIIYNNSSSSGAGIFLKNAHGELINNTVINNDITIEGDCAGLILRNNIIYNSYPDIIFGNQNDTLGVTIDYSLLDIDINIAEHNIIDDPKISDEVLFILEPSSPCIDAGHPDSRYLDVDGSRNDIGAYGGPQK